MGRLAVAKAFQGLPNVDVGDIYFDIPLRKFSWLNIGGPADVLVEPKSIVQVQNLLKLLRKSELPYIVIGDGSNLLFDDAGLRCVVIKIGRALSTLYFEGTVVTAEAGVFVPRLVRRLGNAGLSGLEHAIGIPGTLGGLVLMNGGSQRKGVAENVLKVWAVNELGDVVTYDNAKCHFAYRRSALQDEKIVVVKAALQLSRGDATNIRRKMLEIMRSRRQKFPLKQPNCGSVFLSDPSMYEIIGPPGKVIESCGLKGLRVGGAMIPQRHANFIVNLGEASSDDVLSIIEHVRHKVRQKTKFWLECEVRYVSPDAHIMPAHEALGKK